MEYHEIQNLDSDDDNSLSDDSSSSVEEVFSFTLRDDLKNDIIYCQKNLRIYLKVYEMVLSRRDSDLKMLSARATNTATVLLTKHYLDEIERCIYEINAEQKLLIIKLDSIIDEWHKELEDNDIDFDPDDTSKFISKQLIPLIKSTNFQWEPINVVKRLNEKQLIAKYGLDNDQVLIELDESDIPSNIAFNILQNAQNNDDDDVDDVDDEYDEYDEYDYDDDIIYNNNNTNSNNMKCNNRYEDLPRHHNKKYQKYHNQQSLLKRKETLRDNQVSLLKPKEERFQLNRNSNYKELFSRYISERDNETVQPASRLTETSKRIFVPVSPAVNTSRLNLLQALNKAKTEKTVSINYNTNINRNNLTPSPSPSLASSFNRFVNCNSELPFKPKKLRKKHDRRSSSNRSLETDPLALSPTLSTSSSLSSASSLSVSLEDSPDDNSTREPSPISIEEIKLEPVNAEEYGQEKFLGYFGLYTHDYSNELIKKRSRRKRRNVQSNEKSDYHYGHLDIFESAEKKKKKVYLASPPVIKTCNKKRKIDPNYAVNTLVKISSSSSSTSSSSTSPSAERSNSSSPELEQFGLCNECMNSEYKDQPLSQCDACNGLFHVDCHNGGFINQPIEVKQRICPPCQRDKLNFIAEYQALPSDDGCDDDDDDDEEDDYDDDNDDIKSLTNEHKKLQDNNHELLMKYKKYRGKYYDTLKSKEYLVRRGDTMKAQLNYYFDIVKTFKRDKSV